ncbi:serine/threonine-protein kinase [Terrisporobacter mayombei]|uniref:non-specific serine/threonine protein kinase n=1 Tax=Terrisporobacter mayombei TaxID=1541 RepID=A0ABY9Q2M2_9FIRM|nr:serine/threonine-protein kinase [Terrisporobacter mayombei]MCC3867388.1 serine/threonine protein kinase [Terrisporobacter mayombei]WMT81649.1 Serine/threonine-protein kinase PknB [Terrisporobacter mayombei]
MNINTEFKLSLYEELKSIHKSRKVEIFIVQNIQDEKIYIKKEIKEYTKGIYEIIKNINCKNMPKIYEILEYEDKLIIIEEFINGDTLQKILEKENKLKEKEVIKYIISLCDALYEIHSLNPPIIHRDIKPANIIISNDNVLKLIDFDISRTYKEGESLDTTLLGTKGYASPEQFGFDQTDCRSDIYAMGVMMNVLTTGKHVKEEVNNTLLKDIIKKCTHISAEKRYANVLELKEELKNKLYDKENTKIDKKVDSKWHIKEGKIKTSHNYSKALPGFRSKNPII